MCAIKSMKKTLESLSEKSAGSAAPVNPLLKERKSETNFPNWPRVFTLRLRPSLLRMIQRDELLYQWIEVLELLLFPY